MVFRTEHPSFWKKNNEPLSAISLLGCGAKHQPCRVLVVPSKPPAAWWQEMLEKDTPGQISPCPSLAVQTVSLCWAHQPIVSRALNTRSVTKFVLELVGFYLQGTMQQVMLPGCIRASPGAAAEIRADPAPVERHRPPQAVEVILTVLEAVAAVSEFVHARKSCPE